LDFTGRGTTKICNLYNTKQCNTKHKSYEYIHIGNTVLEESQIMQS